MKNPKIYPSSNFYAELDAKTPLTRAFLASEAHWKYPTSPNVIRIRMLFDNPLVASSYVLRKLLLDQSSSWFDHKYPLAKKL